MAEMGQGTGSGLPMLLAEELECRWDNVKVEFASVNRNIRENTLYGDMLTAGSRGIRTTWPYVQQAGASARERLIQAAAAKWKVPAEDCEARDSKVFHKPSGRSLRYGELVKDAAKITLAAEPAIKTPEQFKLVGTRQPRLDSAIKSTGKATYGIDMREAGPALRLDHVLPRVRRETGIGGRQRHQGRARHQAGGEAGRCGGGGRRQLLARQ